MCVILSLLWRHNRCDGVSNHRPYDCLLNRLFRRRSKKASKLRVTGLCGVCVCVCGGGGGDSPVTGEFPAQLASSAENASIWWVITTTSLSWPIDTRCNPDMMTSSNVNVFRVTGHLCGEFPTQRPVTRSFDVFFDLRLNKRLSKQSWGWWFHCNESSRCTMVAPW